MIWFDFSHTSVKSLNRKWSHIGIRIFIRIILYPVNGYPDSKLSVLSIPMLHPICLITGSVLVPGSHGHGWLCLILYYDTGTTLCETVHLMRPRHTVCGLMRSYVSWFSGGLLPRGSLQVQLQHWSSDVMPPDLPAKHWFHSHDK